MSAIQALLFSYWLLLMTPIYCSDGASIAARSTLPLGSASNDNNSTVAEDYGDLEPSTEPNSTVNSTLLCSREMKVTDKTAEDVRQIRLANIKAQILAKFGLTDSPAVDPALVMSDEQTMSTYYEFLTRHYSQSKDKEECARIKGGKTDFYSKELRVHFPMYFDPVVPSVETFEWGSLFKPETLTKRNTDGKDEGKPSEKESSKNSVGNGDTNLPGSSEGPLTTAPNESPTQSAYSKAEVEVLQTYVAPLVYKLTFNDLALSHSETLMDLSAELRLYKRKKILDNPLIKQDTNPTEKVEIFHVWNSTEIDGVEFRFVTSENVGSERDEYVAFNVTNALRDWQTHQNQSNSLSLEVLVQSPRSITSGRSFLPSIEFDVPNFGKGEHNAQLIIAVPTVEEDTQMAQQIQDTNIQRRRKRQESLENGISTEYCRNNPDETNCCLRDLIINFHRDLNMTWILAPRSVQVNYCEGMCPDYWPLATHSTSFLITFRENNPLSAPEPCCVAASTSPVTMVVAVNNRLYFNHVPDMIVDSCICR